VNGTAYIAFDLSGLPSERRLRVARKASDEVAKERAATMIPEVYAVKLARYREHRAFRETAAEVNRRLRLPLAPGVFVVTPRYVQRVMREGR
jgi:hypothetical protein